jgi:hypothetical protein
MLLYPAAKRYVDLFKPLGLPLSPLMVLVETSYLNGDAASDREVRRDVAIWLVDNLTEIQ